MPSRGLWPALALLQIVGSFALSTAPLQADFYRRGPPLHVRRRSCTACIPDELDAGQSSAPLATLTPPEERSVSVATPQATPQQTTLKAVIALNVVTLLWGSQHAVIKGLIDLTESPALVNAVRFDLAALLALPWLPRPRPDDPEADAAVRATWASGVDLGLWTFAGFSLQAIGLQLTSASRSAFLLYLNVKLVPLLAFFVYGRSVPQVTWISAAIAVAGTGLLTYDGNPPNAGDAWSLAAALASAIFILRLEAAARDTRLLGPAALNAATIATTAALCTAWAVGGVVLSGDNFADIAGPLREQAVPLLYLSLVTTVFANWLQTIGQKEVSAPDAAIIYALDPVYGAGFSFLLLGETLGPQGFAGAGLVLLAVLFSRTAKPDGPEGEAEAGGSEAAAGGSEAAAAGGEADVMPVK